MCDYRNQNPIAAFDGVTLTADYADNAAVISIGGMSKLSIDIDYAQGAAETGNILEMKIEHSTDGTNWHSLSIDETSTVSDITAREWNITGDAALNIILDIAYLFVRVSLKESGVASNAGTATVTVLPSGC
jgi:hypothetical protein